MEQKINELINWINRDYVVDSEEKEQTKFYVIEKLENIKKGLELLESEVE